MSYQRNNKTGFFYNYWQAFARQLGIYTAKFFWCIIGFIMLLVVIDFIGFCLNKDWHTVKSFFVFLIGFLIGK